MNAPFSAKRLSVAPYDASAVHARSVGRAEAKELLNDCLGFAFRRFDAMIWQAFEASDKLRKPAAHSNADPRAPVPDLDIAALIGPKRQVFFTRFRELFEDGFRRRVARLSPSSRPRGDRVVVSARVEYVDSSEQLAFREAIRHLHDVTADERVALALRTSILLGESIQDSEARCPFHADDVCDALTRACRQCWPDPAVRRPVMESLLNAAPVQLLALYRELNSYLQDRQVLATMRESIPGCDVLRPLRAFEGHEALPATGRTSPRAATELVCEVLNCACDDASIPDGIKTLFRQLQPPMLQVALADSARLCEVRHPIHAFCDLLADYARGLGTGAVECDRLMALGDRLVSRLRAGATDARIEMTAATRVLEVLRADTDEKVEQRIASVVAELHRQDAREEKRAAILDALAARMSGQRVPAILHRFLTVEWLDRLIDADSSQGAEGRDWVEQLEMIDNLLRSISPDEPARAEWMVHCDRPVAPSLAAPHDDNDDAVMGLARGDWCAFGRAHNGANTIAKLAWRSRYRTRLLFTSHDAGTLQVHSPKTLAAEFRAGRASVLSKRVPLFERAMRRLIEKRAESDTTARNDQARSPVMLVSMRLAGRSAVAGSASA